MTSYRAKHDTMIAGRPTAEGTEIRGLSDEKAKAYVGAGLIEEIKPEKVSKGQAKSDETFSAAAKKIDTSADKRTEK